MQESLTLDQKRDLYRDGYIIVKGAVSEELTDAALHRINNPVEGEYAGVTTPLTDLVNASSVTPILHEAMGYFDPPIACQVGVLPVREPGKHYNNLGYPDKDSRTTERSLTWMGCAR